MVFCGEFYFLQVGWCVRERGFEWVNFYCPPTGSRTDVDVRAEPPGVSGTRDKWLFYRGNVGICAAASINSTVHGDRCRYQPEVSVERVPECHQHSSPRYWVIIV